MEPSRNHHNPFSFKQQCVFRAGALVPPCQTAAGEAIQVVAFPGVSPALLKRVGAVGRVVAVTAVAIATGWKLEKGKWRSLKSRQGSEGSPHSGAIDSKSP